MTYTEKQLKHLTQAETDVRFEQHRREREAHMQRCLHECQSDPKLKHLYTEHKVTHERGLLEKRIEYAREVISVSPTERLGETLDFWIREEIKDDEHHRSKIDLAHFGQQYGMGVAASSIKEYSGPYLPREYDMLPTLIRSQTALDQGDLKSALSTLADWPDGNPPPPEGLDVHGLHWIDVELI